jgi:hypothetical protein
LCRGRKNKKGRIIGEGSSTAQEGGEQQNYVPPFGGIPALPSYYGSVPMQAWGSGAAMPPPKFAVPNAAFAAARNMQNIAVIQINANQMGEGNANIAYELGHLHLALPGQFIRGAVQSYRE